MTMKIGHAHRWRYKSTWHEKKVGPRLWRFVSPQLKYRIGRHMRRYGSAGRGSTFRWTIQARQTMRKVGPNVYKGSLIGTKRLARARIRRRH